MLSVHVGYDGATSNPGQLMALVRDDSNGAGYAEVIGGTCDDNNWHLFTITRTGGTLQLYMDGVSQGSSTGAGAAAAITTNTRNIGRDGTWVTAGYGNADRQFLAATLDELRISRTIRSADWIITDYNTQSAPASTYSLGAQTATSGGNGTKVVAEACDDGNVTNGDGCTNRARLRPASAAPARCPAFAPPPVATASRPGRKRATTATPPAVTAAARVRSTPPTRARGRRPASARSRASTTTRPSPSTAPRWARRRHPPRCRLTRCCSASTDTSLRTIANGGRVRNASAHDLIFRGVDTTTCGGPVACTMAHEIESYNPATGQLVAWVNIPVLTRADQHRQHRHPDQMFGQHGDLDVYQQLSST